MDMYLPLHFLSFFLLTVVTNTMPCCSVTVMDVWCLVAGQEQGCSEVMFARMGWVSFNFCGSYSSRPLCDLQTVVFFQGRGLVHSLHMIYSLLNLKTIQTTDDDGCFVVLPICKCSSQKSFCTGCCCRVHMRQLLGRDWLFIKEALDFKCSAAVLYERSTHLKTSISQAIMFIYLWETKMVIVINIR